MDDNDSDILGDLAVGGSLIFAGWTSLVCQSLDNVVGGTTTVNPQHGLLADAESSSSNNNNNAFGILNYRLFQKNEDFREFCDGRNNYHFKEEEGHGKRAKHE